MKLKHRCPLRETFAILFACFCLTAGTITVHAQLVPEVRQLAGAGDFASAEKRIAAQQRQEGDSPEVLVAFSWLGRVAVQAKQWDRAESYATQTRQRVDVVLKKRPLDAEPQLPLALGASIEVQGQVLAGTNRRSEAVALLQKELQQWQATSIRTRIQKNLHLLSLEGKPMPKLESPRLLTAAKVPAAASPTIYFFWAHWCVDCKAQGPALATLLAAYPKLVVVAPTQPYGYVAGGEEAKLPQELPYMKQIWAAHFPQLQKAAVPVSEENFRRMGSSTTPTLVFADAKGIVRMYHPGKMPEAELKALLEKYAR